MPVLIATFLACWFVMMLAPETATGRTLRKALIDRPAKRLLRITGGDVATGLVLAFAVAMIAFVGEGDGVRMLMFAAPDVAVWITTFEVSAYLDVLIALTVAVSNLRTRGLGAKLRMIARRPRSRTRRPRSLAPANDDEHPAIAIEA